MPTRLYAKAMPNRSSQRIALLSGSYGCSWGQAWVREVTATWGSGQPGYVLRLGAARKSDTILPPGSILGRVVEFELAVWLSRGDGWGARRQTDAVEIPLDGARLGEGGDDLHGSPAGVACGDVHRLGHRGPTTVY